MSANYSSLGQILGGPAYAFGAGQGPNKKFLQSDFYKNQVTPWSNFFDQNSGYLDYQKQRQDIAAQNPKATQKQLDALFGIGANKYANYQPNQQMLDYQSGKYANDPIVAYAKALYDQKKMPQGDEGIAAVASNMKSGQNINDLMMKAYISSLDPQMQQILNQQVAGKGYGKKLGYDNRANTQALINELNALSGQGYNIKNASGNTAKQIQRLAPDLARYGVKSLNDLSSVKMMNPYTGKEESIFYNKATGTLLPTTFGSSMKGEGGSYFNLHDYNGRVIPLSKWKDTSEAADFAPLAMMAGLAAPFALGPLGASLGGSLAGATGMSTGLATGIANAGLSGLTQGALSSAMGGNFGQGFLGGALGSGITSGIGSLGIGNNIANSLAPLGNTAGEASLNAALSGGIDSALAKGLTGGLSAGLFGGDVGKGVLSGALSGALSGGIGGYLQNDLGSPVSGVLGSLAGKVGTSLLSNAPQAPSGGVTPTAARSSQPSTAISPSVLAQIRQLQGQLQSRGAQTSGLDHLAGWGQKNLGWV